MDQAIQDLLFLAKRFQGILDLVPSLENLGKLDNQVKEKEEYLKSLKLKSDSEDELFEYDKNHYQDLRDSWNVDLQKRQTQLDEMSLAAKMSAENLINQAKDQVEQLKNKAQKELDDLSSYVSDLQTQKKILVADVVSYTNQKETLVKAIADIKSKL